MPKGLRTLAFSFDDAHLTHFSGLVLLQRFCQQFRLRWLLQRDVLPPQATGDFQPADLLLALIYVLVAGLRRVSKTQILQYNGAFLCLLGLERFPDPSSLRRFLQRLSPHTIRQLVRLHDRLRAALGKVPPARSTLLFDLDAVVLTLYGRQQGARLGYNPKKKGRRSYHPLLCFEAHGQEFWHGSLRPGDTSANTGVLGFLERCVANVAFFQTLMLAYNLVRWFKRLCLPKSYGAATVETVRRDFLAVPGRLVNRGHRHVLHLPRDYPWQKELLGAGRAIRKLRLRNKI